MSLWNVAAIIEIGSFAKQSWNWNTDDYLVSFPPKDKCWAFALPGQLLTPKPFMHEFIAGLDWKKPL